MKIDEEYLVNSLIEKCKRLEKENAGINARLMDAEALRFDLILKSSRRHGFVLSYVGENDMRDAVKEWADHYYEFSNRSDGGKISESEVSFIAMALGKNSKPIEVVVKDIENGRRY